MSVINNVWPKQIKWKQKRRWGSMKKMITPVANVYEMKVAIDKILTLREKGEAELIGIDQ